MSPNTEERKKLEINVWIILWSIHGYYKVIILLWLLLKLFSIFKQPLLPVEACKPADNLKQTEMSRFFPKQIF